VNVVRRAPSVRSTSSCWGVLAAAVVQALLLGVLSLALTLGGCSSGGGAASSTTATTATASSTRTSTTSFIVGDKTQEAYEAEIPELEAKVKADPSDLTSLQELAKAYYNLNRFQDAANTYEKMLAIHETPLMRNNYGNMLRDLGRTEEAKTAYRTALAADPTLTVAYVNLASLLFLEGKKDEAYQVLDEGISKLDGADKTRLENIKATFQKQT
jgi:tetratricopeptide (TPR) repeat protein